MSEEKQKQVDLKSYIPYFRNFHVFLGLSFTLIALILYFFVNEMILGIFITTYPILAYMYFIWNTRNFSVGANKNAHKIGVYILGATLVFVLFMEYLGAKNDKIHIEKDYLKIEGSYGEIIHYSEIKEIKLKQSLPKITTKIHGFAMGNIHKGKFKTSSGEKIKLVLNSDLKPCIFILTYDGNKVYFSTRKDESNEEIFQKIKIKISEFHSGNSH